MSDPEFPDFATRNDLVPGCTRCPALADARECIAWGNGRLDADVVVVGEAPAAGDPQADAWQGGNRTGLAYTSRHSGRRIRTLFGELGYDPYYTNAVKCFPRATAHVGERGNDSASRGDGTDAVTNREPTADERRRCASHLLTELEQVDPAVVVPTGKHATASVLSLAGREVDGFLDTVLEPVDCEALGITVLPVLHPSYQDVWIARLGYDAAEYRDAIGDALAGLV